MLFTLTSKIINYMNRFFTENKLLDQDKTQQEWDNIKLNNKLNELNNMSIQTIIDEFEEQFPNGLVVPTLYGEDDDDGSMELIKQFLKDSLASMLDEIEKDFKYKELWFKNNDGSLTREEVIEKEEVINIINSKKIL